MTAILVVAAAALVAGYVLGRVRPWDRLDTWVWRRFAFMGAWTKSKPQAVLTIAAHVLVRPRQSLGIYLRGRQERRHPPEPTRAPALRFRDHEPEEPTS